MEIDYVGTYIERAQLCVDEAVHTDGIFSVTGWRRSSPVPLAALSIWINDVERPANASFHARPDVPGESTGFLLKVDLGSEAFRKIELRLEDKTVFERRY